jgi:hypothetical protein
MQICKRNPTKKQVNGTSETNSLHIMQTKLAVLKKDLNFSGLMLWQLDVSCNQSNQIKSNQSFYDVVGCDAAIKIKASTVWKDDCSYIG